MTQAVSSLRELVAVWNCKQYFNTKFDLNVRRIYAEIDGVDYDSLEEAWNTFNVLLNKGTHLENPFNTTSLKYELYNKVLNNFYKDKILPIILDELDCTVTELSESANT